MQSTERRQSLRLPFFARIRLVGRAETYYHPTQNLSSGGAFLKTEFPLDIGTKLNVELEDPLAGGWVKVKALVAWRREGARPGTPEALAQPPIESGMGISFVHLQREEEEALNGLISRMAQEGAPAAGADDWDDEDHTRLSFQPHA